MRPALSARSKHPRDNLLHFNRAHRAIPLAARRPFLRVRPSHRMIKISLQPEGPAGVSVLEPPVPKPSDADVSPPLTKPLGTDLQPLELRGRDVVTADGAPVLRCLDHRATVRVQEDGSLVIGVASPSGATPMLDVALGQLAAKRYLALGRTSLWWMTPAWGTTAAEIPTETQFLLAELEDGSCAVLLPLLPTVPTGRFRATLRSAGPGDLGVRVESGAAGVASDTFPSALLVAAGRDPFEVVARGVAAAAALSGTSKPSAAKEMPATADLFGWCTWDAFYSTVSASGIQEGLKSFAQGGVAPRFLIIDDGWQQTDVDPEYRSKSAGPVSTTSAAASAGQPNGATKAASEGASAPERAATITTEELEVEHAVHAMEEAAAELLAGEGDRIPDQVRGEHQLEEEQMAALAAPEATKGAFPGSWVVSALARCVAVAMARLEAAVLHFGKRLLDSATSKSWIVRAFAALAVGPLRPSLLRFFANTSDHTRRLTAIEANAKFATPDTGPGAPLSAPGGDLRSVVTAIKSRFGVQYVYAWHAMGAFWCGVGMNDPGVAKYAAKLLHPRPTPGVQEVDPSVAWVQPVLAGVSLPLDPTQLHSDMHAYLASCGVDGVKVDVQGTIGLVGSEVEGGTALAEKYHESLEASVAQHFPGNHLINCMCHSTEDLYNMTNTNLARVSDDFYPLRPASHTSHLSNCAFNSLFMGELVGVDWDMFHSRHPAALLHATARAISGGPVYVSDRPGNHDFDLLRRLVLADGSVLRCRLPGRPTADCLFANVSRDNATALKVWNVNPVTGVVGVFNVQGSTFSRTHRAFHTHDHNPPTLTATVRPKDVARMAWREGDMAALYSDKQGTFTVVNAVDGESGLTLTVEPNGGCDVVVISRVHSAGPVLFAPIGLTQMLNAGGAVLESELREESNGSGDAVASLKVKGSGPFLAYASHRPEKVMVGGAQVAFEYVAVDAALRFNLPEDSVGGLECIIEF